MDKNLNLEELSEEEIFELCLKLLNKANQDVLDMKKSLDNTINYCNSLDNFAKKYPLLAYKFILSKN